MRTLAIRQLAKKSAKQKQYKTSVRSLFPSSAMLQRKPGCPCGGGCPRCQEQALLQPKLKINEPGDKYEQEADRIADEVMRMPEPAVQHQVEPEKEETVQKKAIARRNSSELPPIVNEVVNSPGQPLDPETRTFMESRFGRGFSQVRVHTDAKALESAQAVNARAYTVRQNIVFGAEQYAPKTAAGQQLLAHELTHTIQQSQSAEKPLERSANFAVGNKSAVNLFSHNSTLATPIVQRQKRRKGKTRAERAKKSLAAARRTAERTLKQFSRAKTKKKKMKVLCEGAQKTASHLGKVMRIIDHVFGFSGRQSLEPDIDRTTKLAFKLVFRARCKECEELPSIAVLAVLSNRLRDIVKLPALKGPKCDEEPKPVSSRFEGEFASGTVV